MRRAGLLAVCAIAASCGASPPRPFALRVPFTQDTDTRPVSVPCRADPSDKEPDRVTCAPAEYFSPFRWNQIENTVFGPLSRLFSIDVVGEAANANSLDEVADSSWFENRIGVRPLTAEEESMGSCKPEDILPADVADGAWVIDHGKDNGATPGFRINVPGKGLYMLKVDDADQPERATGSSVVGTGLYQAAGFNTTCEQIVFIRRAQLTLTPGLTRIDNSGTVHPFDEKALDAALARSSHLGDQIRMHASKWLPGLPLGPFRYEHTRSDDPNDIIDHENRRELRGSNLLAAWMNHWDAREQNSMDLWISSDPKNKRASPGYVKHYILDTSDTLGGESSGHDLTIRLGRSYMVDLPDVLEDFVTLGLLERSWDRLHAVKGREKFGLFSTQEFDPTAWKSLYPNPAFLRMTERDAAWMARIIARFSPDDVHRIVDTGRFHDPTDVDYLTQVLVARQQVILARYLSRLSPVADVHAVGADQICAVDLARLRGVFAADRFHYTAIERHGDQRFELPVTAGPDGAVCFAPRSVARQDLPADDPARIVIFELRNGTLAGPLEIHTYDLGDHGMHVVGLIRPPA